MISEKLINYAAFFTQKRFKGLDKYCFISGKKCILANMTLGENVF